MLILVTTSFYDPISNDRWELFVGSTKALLEQRYELVTEEGMSQVWRLR